MDSSSTNSSVQFNCILQVPILAIMMDVTNHGGNMIESQTLRQPESPLWWREIDGNVSCNYEGQLKRRRADLATNDEVKSRRQELARGPVSMSEIRRLQDALYNKSPTLF